MGVKIATGRHFRRIEECEFVEARRQLVAAGHLGALDEDRDERHVPRHRGLDLDPDRIGYLAHPGFAGGVDSEPLRADHDDQNFAFPQNGRNVRPEIGSIRNVVDVRTRLLP